VTPPVVARALTADFAYTPDQRLASVVKTGADKGSNQSYVDDAARNVKSQSVGGVATTMTYDRNWADRVAVEEQTNTAGVWEVAKAYTHGPGGE
jgi:hypothetical protein